MLYVLPAFLIAGVGLYGCRVEERRLAVIIGSAATIAFIPALVLAMTTDQRIAKGFAYALMTVAAVQWSMLLGRRRGESGESGGGEGRSLPRGPRPPEPIDWADFERRFWDQVREGPSGGVPPAPRSRDRSPV